ncbi:MAG TPA: DUF6243 family protein [Spirillospora sp.]
MAKKRRNGLLGVGGQRENLSRRALRGGTSGSSGARGDAAAKKEELLRKMRERTRRRAASEQDSEPARDAASE